MKNSLLRCKWVEPALDRAVCELFAKELGISFEAACVLYQRGIRSAEEAHCFLNVSLTDMHSPFLFRDMERAVDRIAEAIKNNEKVLIYGDYDVDGVTGVAILLTFLRYCGLDPSYYIPHRLREGYGLNPEAIPAFKSRGVTLVVTVDCGSSSGEALEAAHRCGIDVIVTDHHESTCRLPQVRALLNPKRADSGFPFAHLAGVGVAFYLIMALRTRLRERGFWGERREPNLLRYLDLVALGTIADMVPLRNDNRIIAKFGMNEISLNTRPGIYALKERTGLLERTVDTRTILFRLGPRINAAGRLGFAEESVELCACEDIAVARDLARTLEERNAERKSIEEAIYLEARFLAEEQIQTRDAKVLVLASEDWHRGILGIVASRIAQEFYRPTVVISLEEQCGKGSARTVGDIHLLEALDLCKEWLVGYGGHQGAAGIVIESDAIEHFRAAFEAAVMQQLHRGDRQLLPSLQVDVTLQGPHRLTEKVVSDFERLAPFGYGNPEPVVALKGMRIFEKRVVGEHHLRLVVAKDGLELDAVGFGMGHMDPFIVGTGAWDLACTPYLDSWSGSPKLCLRLIDLRPT